MTSLGDPAREVTRFCMEALGGHEFGAFFYTIYLACLLFRFKLFSSLS